LNEEAEGGKQISSLRENINEQGRKKAAPEKGESFNVSKTYHCVRAVLAKITDRTFRGIEKKGGRERSITI